MDIEKEVLKRDVGDIDIEVTPEMFAAYEERRRTECINKIQAVLNEYGYTLKPVSEVKLVKV